MDQLGEKLVKENSQMEVYAILGGVVATGVVCGLIALVVFHVAFYQKEK